MANSSRLSGAMASLISDGPFAQTIMSYPALSAVAAVLLVALFVNFSLNKTPNLDLPIVGEPGSKIGKKDIVEGARKVC